jgi:ribosomal subunit interface protein
MFDIQSKNLKLSSEQEELIKEKVGKLLHLSSLLQDESTKIRVEVDHDPIQEKHKRIYTTVTIYIPKHTLRAEVHEKTLESSLDKCEDKLRHQIEKIKTKVIG